MRALDTATIIIASDCIIIQSKARFISAFAPASFKQNENFKLNKLDAAADDDGIIIIESARETPPARYFAFLKHSKTVVLNFRSVRCICV